MQKNIILVIVAVLVLGGIIWFARPSNIQPARTTDVVQSGGPLTSNFYDFGTISMRAGTVSHMFPIKNDTAAPINLTKMYTSCMCTTARLMMNGQTFGPVGMPGHGMIPMMNMMMTPGGEAQVEVTFDPAAHGPAGVGKISRVVTVEREGAEPLTFNFSANVTP